MEELADDWEDQLVANFITESFDEVATREDTPEQAEDSNPPVSISLAEAI